jgi:hypothetical protein
VQQDVAGDLEDGIADEEQPGTERVRSGADAVVGLELRLCERHVAAVQERDDVHQEQEREEPPEHLLGGLLAELVAASRRIRG